KKVDNPQEAEEISAPEFTNRFNPFLSWLSQFDCSEQQGLEGMRKLRRATVTIIGLGGTGSLCAKMLAAIGVGTIRLIDGDKIESSNLVRQMFYTESDIDQLKTEVLKRHITDFTKFTHVECKSEFVKDAKHV